MVHHATVLIKLGLKEGCRAEQRNKKQKLADFAQLWVLLSYGNLGNAQMW